MIQLINGNSLIKLKNIESESITSIVTDPPYEIGFMGKKWDNTGIAYSSELWIECLRVLKPGGFLLSFSSARTYHRMACAIEDSGFEIRDMIEWIYGSGFPKSLDLGKHDEKFKGIGTSLKPAHEPICMARKPLFENTVLKNFEIYSAGALNIDKCRIEHSEKEVITNRTAPKSNGSKMGLFTEKDKYASPNLLGRFPSNLIHDGSDEILELFPFTKTGGGDRRANKIGSIFKIKETRNEPSNFESNSGSASRFFYCAKPSKSERGYFNTHPTVKPLKLMEYLIKMVTPENGIVLDPFMGSGTTGIACSILGFSFIGIELEKESFDIAQNRIQNAKTFFS